MDAEAYDNVNVGFVQDNGYANLGCVFVPGCPGRDLAVSGGQTSMPEHLMPRCLS